MSHLLHRSIKASAKPTMAVENPIQRAVIGIGDQHLGTTRFPRSRVLKPPLG